MENKRKIQALIKKINMIYKKGYLPEREAKKYSLLYTKAVNCFGHACFNLSNKDLKTMDPDLLNELFRNFGGCGFTNYFKVAQERIRQVGLKIETSSVSEHIEKNQWKIAYYIMHDEFKGNDIHFMIQTKSGKWTSKLGSSSKIEVLDKLPKNYKKDYSLMGVYKITNPYVKLDKEKDMEM